MKEEKKINVVFYEPDENVMPFVKIRFKGQNSKMQTALMLMDTGTTLCMLAPEMRKFIKDKDWLPEESSGVVSITSESTKTPCANFQFELGEIQFQEKFIIMDNFPPMEYDDLKVVGILGNRFMQKHRLSMDYANLTVHTSELTLGDIKPDILDVFIPFGYGLKYYNAPTINIKGKEHDIIMVLDSGANNIILSKDAIEENALPYHTTGNTYPLDGSNGSVNAEECEMELEIPVNSDRNKSISFCETIMMIPHSIDVAEDGECDENGIPLSTIDGMLSSPFMAQEKWVLDFGIEAVYKFKS